MSNPRRIGALRPGRRPGGGRAVLGVAGGLTWIVLLTVVQLDVDGRLFVVPALSLSALVLSLITSWRPTLVVALCGVIAVAILSQHVQGLFTADGIVRTTGSAALGAFAVANSVLRLRRDRRIRTMTEVATIAQAAIMQPVPARVGPLDMASRYVSASADALVGGDLFDVVDTQVGVRIIVGDVRGKGLSSVRIASRALSSFRRVAPHAHVGLIDVALAIEDQLRVLLGDEDFVTVVLCQFHDDGRLEVVNCGHHPPFRLVAGQPPVVLSTIAESLPLGLGATPHADTFRLEPGERLLLFTDGLVEARNSDGVYFDIEAACEELANTETNLDDALDQLVEQVRSHVGGVVNDDLCVLLASQGVEVGTGTEADEVADWGRASRTT